MRKLFPMYVYTFLHRNILQLLYSYSLKTFKQVSVFAAEPAVANTKDIGLLTKYLCKF